MLLKEQRYLEASVVCKWICQRAKNDIEVWSLYARLSYQLGDIAQAISCYKQMLIIDKGNDAAKLNLAQLSMVDGDIATSEKLLTELHGRKGGTDASLFALANLYDKTGRYNECLELLERLNSSELFYVESKLLLASISEHIGQVAESIKTLNDLIKNANLKEVDKSRLYFALGALYDYQGDYAAAFATYALANKLKVSRGYNYREVELQTHKLIACHKKIASSSVSNGNSNVQSCFILGMPRSGTSLVEQILDSHKDVNALCENSLINKAISGYAKDHNAMYPEFLSTLSSADVNSIKTDYGRKLEQLTNINARLVTDKLPSNFYHLGFIDLILPESVVVHCQRNPLDTCLSIYFTDFMSPLDYAYDLNTISHFYKQYDQIMAYWEEALNINIINYEYEALVADKETMTHKLLEGVGLDWDERCLKHNENTRYVNTASYQQVKKKIYNKSVNRWKNYENYIPELIDIFS